MTSPAGWAVKAAAHSTQRCIVVAMECYPASVPSAKHNMDTNERPVLTHDFWHTKSVSENVGAELLRRSWPNNATGCAIESTVCGMQTRVAADGTNFNCHRAWAGG